jgi:hypothetical protein
MRIWAKLRHENVVRLLGYTEEPEGPGLVSIAYLHGDVVSFLAKNPSVNREIIVGLHRYVPPDYGAHPQLSLIFTVYRCCTGITILA